MNNLLLLGAGFSRNWGGWLANEAFEYLLGCSEIRDSPTLKQLLWKHKAQGGFEGALADMQNQYVQYPTAKEHLIPFQAAVSRMFEDMNKAFWSLASFEFQTDMRIMVRSFLLRFDAIFTLNQDLLLERHYLDGNVLLGSNGRWNGFQIPGVRQVSNNYPQGPGSYPNIKWVSQNSNEFKVEDRHQPYFKLHGSSEWKDESNKEMLIMGGNKDQAILTFGVLKWYYQEFWNRLLRPDTRLMIIGYSFGDGHINKAIFNAANKGLRIFIIDPLGVDVFQNSNPTRNKPIYVRGELEETLEPITIGASRRPLREIFGINTDVEHGKVMKFFE